MWRVVVLCWVFIAPTLGGILVLVTLLIPALAPDLKTWIPVVAAAGFVLGIPAAIIFAKTQGGKFA